jgi:hypothetical protein
LIFQLRDRGQDGRPVAHVGDGVGRSDGAEFGDEFAERFFLAIEQGQPGAFASQDASELSADAAAGAGDQDDAIREGGDGKFLG